MRDAERLSLHFSLPFSLVSASERLIPWIFCHFELVINSFVHSLNFNLSISLLFSILYLSSFLPSCCWRAKRLQDQEAKEGKWRKERQGKEGKGEEKRREERRREEKTQHNRRREKYFHHSYVYSSCSSLPFFFLLPSPSLPSSSS